MKASILSMSLVAGLVAAQGSVDTWAPGGPDDFRGPCPMMNTLANHGFLPHDGKNLTEDIVVGGLHRGLGFNVSVATIMFQQALVSNPIPNATWFDLNLLNVHNVLEHDASMSRQDFYFGNNHVFNQTIFDTTKQFWTGEILNATQLANGKLFRQIVSRATNPTYTFGEKVQPFSLGEVSAPIVAFGDLKVGTVNRTLVEYWIENERLPSELGWVQRPDNINLTDVAFLSALIDNATNFLTADSTTTTTKRFVAHSGMLLH